MLNSELIVETQLEDFIDKINISDALGHHVLLPYSVDSGKIVFFAAGLPAGIYIVQIYTSEGVKAVKIQINH